MSLELVLERWQSFLFQIRFASTTIRAWDSTVSSTFRHVDDGVGRSVLGCRADVLGHGQVTT